MGTTNLKNDTALLVKLNICIPMTNFSTSRNIYATEMCAHQKSHTEMLEMFISVLFGTAPN